MSKKDDRQYSLDSAMMILGGILHALADEIRNQGGDGNELRLLQTEAGLRHRVAKQVVLEARTLHETTFLLERRAYGIRFVRVTQFPNSPELFERFRASLEKRNLRLATINEIKDFATLAKGDEKWDREMHVFVDAPHVPASMSAAMFDDHLRINHVSGNPSTGKFTGGGSGGIPFFGKEELQDPAGGYLFACVPLG